MYIVNYGKQHHIKYLPRAAHINDKIKIYKIILVY